MALRWDVTNPERLSRAPRAIAGRSDSEKARRVRKTTGQVIAALVRAGLSRRQALEVSQLNIDAALAGVAHPDRAAELASRVEMAAVGLVVAARARRAA